MGEWHTVLCILSCEMFLVFKAHCKSFLSVLSVNQSQVAVEQERISSKADIFESNIKIQQ